MTNIRRLGVAVLVASIALMLLAMALAPLVRDGTAALSLGLGFLLGALGFWLGWQVSAR
jgi:hypothetical protein